MREIDPRGLDSQDRKYLETVLRVFLGGPAPVEAVAHTMNASTDTLGDGVEPYLLRSGLVAGAPRGGAHEHLGYEPPKPGDEPQKRLFS